jgi:hypothetical protein
MTAYTPNDLLHMRAEKADQVKGTQYQPPFGSTDRKGAHIKIVMDGSGSAVLVEASQEDRTFERGGDDAFGVSDS